MNPTYDLLRWVLGLAESRIEMTRYDDPDFKRQALDRIAAAQEFIQTRTRSMETINTPHLNGPDYSHSGEFIDWGDVPLDERFGPLIERARSNMGQDVELFRWSPEDPVKAEIERKWGKQRDAIKRHVGALSGLKMTTTSRMHKDFGVKIAYIRFNRTRPVVVRSEETA